MASPVSVLTRTGMRRATAARYRHHAVRRLAVEAAADAMKFGNGLHEIVFACRRNCGVGISCAS